MRDNRAHAATSLSRSGTNRLMQAADDTAQFETFQAQRNDRWANLLSRAAALIQSAPTADIASPLDAARQLFAEFYAESAALALCVARRVATERYAEDVLADSYLQAWKNLTTFDANRGQAGAWLLTIVRSRALDKLRNEKLRKTLSLDEGIASDADSSSTSLIDSIAAPSESTPQALLESTQSQSLVRRALADLSHNERWVLSLAYFRDMSHSEIALATSLPLGTVKSLTSRSLAKLRTALGQ